MVMVMMTVMVTEAVKRMMTTMTTAMPAAQGKLSNLGILIAAVSNGELTLPSQVPTL